MKACGVLLVLILAAIGLVAIGAIGTTLVVSTVTTQQPTSGHTTAQEVTEILDVPTVNDRRDETMAGEQSGESSLEPLVAPRSQRLSRMKASRSKPVLEAGVDIYAPNTGAWVPVAANCVIEGDIDVRATPRWHDSIAETGLVTVFDEPGEAGGYNGGSGKCFGSRKAAVEYAKQRAGRAKSNGCGGGCSTVDIRHWPGDRPQGRE